MRRDSDLGLTNVRPVDLEDGLRGGCDAELVRSEGQEVVGIVGGSRRAANSPNTLVASVDAGPGPGDWPPRNLAEVGQAEIAEERAAVRVRVRAHPPVATRGHGGHLGTHGSARIE